MDNSPCCVHFYIGISLLIEPMEENASLFNPVHIFLGILTLPIFGRIDVGGHTKSKHC